MATTVDWPAARTRTTVAAAPLRRKRGLAVSALLAGVLLICVCSVLFGAKAIAPSAVLDALLQGGNSEEALVVQALRVPRTLLGLLAGLSLGAAGALIQGHTRNPLADPGLLGVNQGAAFAVVLATVVFGVNSLYGYVWCALAGALLASVVVFALGRVGGKLAGPVTLALAGAAVSHLLHGVLSAVVLGDRQGMEIYRFWNVGSLAARDYVVVGQIAPFLLVGLVLALANTPGMNTLALGDDVATALGRKVWRTRAFGVVTITLLAGASVAACGPIAFLGLIVPHLARLLVGPDYRWLVPASALLGAVLLLAADVLGRVVASDEFEVGIMLAALGAPVFLALVRRKGLVRL